MMDARSRLLSQARWRWYEPLLWALAFALPALLPGQALIVNEIAIVALFAVSLDLVLGYTGIVTLGHAAFLGFGAYCAALFAKFIHPDPLLGTCAALGTLPAQTLMVGDSSNDAQAANAAGCPVVLMTYGYNHGEPIRQTPALAWLDSLQELLPLL